jgi:predicted SAM-dependent methyltransferase
MKRIAQTFLERVYLLSAARNIVDDLGLLKRKLGRIDSRLIEDYDYTHRVKKLHIGCGNHILKNWLNSDFLPRSNKILHLDATQLFPIESHTFNYVFSEHMIEHISYSEGRSMLTECHRILKNNGKIRISTPDLSFLIDIYGSNKSEILKQYIEWSMNESMHSTENSSSHAAFVINNFVRSWGHTFIYDEDTLRLSFKKAGFSKIMKCDLQVSEDEELQNLENEERMPPGFVRLETITLEATKNEER